MEIGWLIILGISMLLFLVLYITTLVYQAKRSQWVWFILTLLFGIVTIIYWITWMFSPKLRRKR